MRLTPEILFGRLPVGPQPPSDIKLSPDGRHGSYLRPADDDRERLELWLVDMESAATRRLLSGAELDAAEPTAQEKAERERRRVFARGVVAYEWHPDSQRLLVPAAGAAYLVRVSDGAIHRETPAQTTQGGFQLSPKGTFLSFVRDGDLIARRLADGVETRLTHDGGGTVSNGLAEFIAQEEMARLRGHWWAPDESALACTRVDTAPIPETQRFEVEAGGVRTVAQRYPFAGGPNAEVRLGLVGINGEPVRWLDWAVAEDDYLARVDYAPDGALFVQAQSRDQRRLALRRYADGHWREILTEQARTWVNLHDNLKFLPDGRFLWTSERDGDSQLYMCEHRPEGLALDRLAPANRVLGATDAQAWVTASVDDVSQAVWHVPLARDSSPSPTQICEGQTAAAVCAKAGRVLVVFSSRVTPPHMMVVDFNGLWLGRPIALPKPRRVIDIGGKTTLGQWLVKGVTLHYRLTWPSSFNPNRRYPVVVHVYGGPGVQRVREEFPPLTLQLFAQAGFGVFELDNRGSANRGTAFEGAIHGRLGRVEVEDQLAGVRFLREQPWVDASRIGVFGHSYGGYMVLMCLASSHAFAAGASVAPVTKWTLYDTHYTERYLGTPQDNPQGYADSAVLPRVGDIDAPLLLMHGMADDNVLFAHSTALMKALQDAGVPFEMMTYPGAKHSLQEPSVAIHRHNTILDFFRRTLGRGGVSGCCE